MISEGGATIQDFIRYVLNEAPGGSASAAFEKLEQAVKTKYDAAKVALDAWRANEAKKTAYIAASKAAGVSPDGEAARKRFKSTPAFNYDPKLAQKKEKTLLDDLKKAAEKYAEFNPEISDYVRKKSGGSRSLSSKELPERGKKVYVKIRDVKPVTWYSWPKAVQKSGKKFGDIKSKGGDEESGVGPGEEWLAYIFGGQVQGGSVSYDVVTPDGRAWEVKALKSASETLRPGTEGSRAIQEPRARLENIMKQLKTFTKIIDKLDMTPTKDDVAQLKYLKSFVDDEFEMIVSKGEISQDRFVALRAALRVTKEFKEKYAGRAKPIDTRIALNKKEVTVDKPTFIDVAQRVEKATGDPSILSGVEEFEIALSALRDEAFQNPAIFFDEWFESINVNEVFSQVDGVFIVNMRGYSMVPRSLMSKAFKFDKVTQGKPRFSYVFFGNGPQ